MSSVAPLSPLEKRRFLSACAAALPPLIFPVVIFCSMRDGWGPIGFAAAILMTVMLCSGPILFLPVPCLAPAVGMIVMFVWILRVRTTRMGDWGWMVHLAISAAYLLGMYGMLEFYERMW